MVNLETKDVRLKLKQKKKKSASLLLNLRSTVNKLVAPELVDGVLYQLDERYQ